MNILRTNPGDENFHLFENLPLQLFADNEFRKQQEEVLNTEFLDHCLVLMEDNIPKARLAVYLNPHLKYKKKPVLCIGNYECVNETKYSKALLEFAFAKAKTSKCKYILGPINSSTWNNYRFKTDNIQQPFFLEPEHPIYYNDHFKKAGFKTVSKYTSYLISELSHLPLFDDKTQKKLDLAKIKIRNIDHDDYENELRKIYDLSLASFTKNSFYTPISWESFIAKFMPLKAIAKPEHTIIAENKKGETVGFLFAIDDLFCKSEKRIISKTIVHKNSILYNGLGTALLLKLHSYAVENNYNSMIYAFMISEGTFDAYSAKIGSLYREYNLYIKEL